MTSEQYRQALDALGLTVVTAAQFLSVNEQTARRWAEGEWVVPETVAMLLMLMIRYQISPEEARQIFTGAAHGTDGQ